MKINEQIKPFVNEHGWFSYTKFNKWTETLGITVEEGFDHNKFDGMVHFFYHYKSNILNFRGNYWDYNTFKNVTDWINKQTEVV